MRSTSAQFSLNPFALLYPRTLSYLRHLACFSLVMAALSLHVPAVAQQAPPTLGQETKGQPAAASTDQAADETTPQETLHYSTAEQSDKEAQKPESAIDNLLGTTKVTESKRESGQLYRIELEHSGGTKQYIEETDSDGKIESTSNDIEETPNLPKWKLGSW